MALKSDNDAVTFSTLGSDFEEYLCDTSTSTPEQVSSDISLSKAISGVLAGLKEREETVLRLRLGINKNNQEKTLEEVGEIYGVTRERIRQIEAKALKLLRHHNRNDVLAPYSKSISIYEPHEISKGNGTW